MRPTTLRLNNTLYWTINVFDPANPDTAIDADSNPIVAVRKNGAATADIVTVTKRAATTGIYDCSYNPAAEAIGDQFTIEESATISATVYRNSAWNVAVILAASSFDPQGDPVTVGSIEDNVITAQSINPNALNGKGNWNVGKTGYSLAAAGLDGVTLPANLITATSIAANALNGKGNWNVGKTGYSLVSQNWATALQVAAAFDEIKGPGWSGATDTLEIIGGSIGGGNQDWTATERQQIRSALGVAGDQATPAAGGQLQTVLARIGAFAGTGVNSIFGWLQALARKDVAPPSEIGGTYDPARHSLEANGDGTTSPGGAPANAQGMGKRKLLVFRRALKTSTVGETGHFWPTPAANTAPTDPATVRELRATVVPVSDIQSQEGTRDEMERIELVCLADANDSVYPGVGSLRVGDQYFRPGDWDPIGLQPVNLPFVLVEVLEHSEVHFKAAFERNLRTVQGRGSGRR